jgi:DNA-binding response OmpR family regulator
VSLNEERIAKPAVEQNDFEVCGETDGWHKALKDICTLRPDVVVTELKLRDGNGWELVRRTVTGEVNTPSLF